MGSYLDFTKQRDRATQDQQLVQMGRQQSMLGPQQDVQPRPRPPLQAAPQQQQTPPSEQWFNTIGGLNKGYNELDAAGQAQVNDLNHRSESLLASKGQLRAEEFQQAVKSLSDRAIEYPWNHHVKPKGSNPGDIIEEDGVQKLRGQDGTLEPINYTAEYIQKNTIPIGTTGQVAIPLGPNKGYKVVEARDRDVASERTEIDKAEKGISAIYDQLVKKHTPEKEVKDADGKVLGVLPFTSTETRAMAIQASDGYIKSQMQAKHAATVIADAGTSELQRAMSAEVKDPFKTEQQILDTQKEIFATRGARKDAAKELLAEKQQNQTGPPPTPSPSPVPGQDQVDPGLAGMISGGGSKSPTDRLADSTEYYRLKGIQDATVSGGDLGHKMAQAANNRRALKVTTKDEMNEKYLNDETPEGLVVELADGRKYIKDEGKFWQVPWSEKQIASPTMLDAKGKEITDPSTRKPAVGIAQQLEAGRSQEIRQAGAPAQVPGAVTPEAAATGVQDDVAGQHTGPTRMETTGINSKTGKLIREKAPQPVNPAATARAAEGVDPRRIPKPDTSAPAVATQEAEQAAMRQRHDENTKFDTRRTAQKFKSLPAKAKKAIRNAKPLKKGQSPDTIAVGEAFIAGGEVYIKLGDGSYDGPYSVNDTANQVAANTIF